MKTYTKTIDAPMLEIQHDVFADNPRKMQTNLGYFITCEKNYNSPDENEELKSLIQNCGDESKNITEHIASIKTEMKANGYGKVLYITPVYRYEHGNVSYKRGTAHGFDYSNCGFYIITDKTLKEMPKKKSEWGRIIDNELEQYTDYANGEVYSFTLYDEVGEVQDQGGNYSLESIQDGLPKEWKGEKVEDYIVS